MPVTAEVLFKGAWYALEQCGIDVRVARLLHHNGEYPSAATHALLAHEGLGLHEFLFELWTKAVQGGPLPTVEEIRAFSLDHEKKQERGHRGMHLSGTAGGRLQQLITQVLRNPPDSPEANTARKEMQQLTQRISKHKPGHRHKTRKRSVYVDLNDRETDWSRPSDITTDEATQIVREALLAYMTDWGNLRVALDPSSGNKELVAALRAWPNHPELPVPESLEKA